MSKKSPGSKYAMKAGRTKYLAERERFRQKRDRRLEQERKAAEIGSYFHLTEASIEQIDPDAERRAS
jgi:hypothetical protein